MQARRALLKKLAMINDLEASSRASFDGESWLESRNTVFRFRDGVCFDLASRDPRKTARAQALVGMRLVGWVVSEGTLFTHRWEAGGCAVLWRPGSGVSEEAIAMTSATTSFTRGSSGAHLQTLHDRVPPVDSQAFRREDVRGATRESRPKLASSSYRSG